MTREMKPKMLYTSPEVQDLFGVNRNTVTNWCKKGILTKIKKPGVGRLYITAESVETFLKGM